MFNFIFQIIQAYYQVGYFIAAVICLGFGGLILGNALYWRIHAVRMKGTILGVIERGGMYTPVYRYTLPDGGTRMAKSDTSSSSLGGNETGRAVTLLILPHDPSEAREARSILLDCIGVVLIVPGVWFGYTALSSYSVTWMTWVLAAAMALYLGERAYRLFIPRGRRLPVAEWRQQHGLNAAIDISQIKHIEDILVSPDSVQKRQAQQANNRRAAPIVAAFVMALFGIAVYQARNIARLEAFGLRANGEVVRVVGQSASGGHTSYYPIVRYRTEKSALVEFKNSIGANPPTYRSGEKVSVLYLADDPRGGPSSIAAPSGIGPFPRSCSVARDFWVGCCAPCCPTERHAKCAPVRPSRRELVRSA
jgi:hypothetical protein